MQKTIRNIICVVSAVIAVAAAVYAIIRYQNEIAAFFSGLKEKLCRKDAKFTTEEYEDFADI